MAKRKPKRAGPLEKPEAIILTISQGFFKNYYGGEERFRRIMEVMNDSEMIWHQTISGFPQYEILYCYLVFNGKVQYRCNIISYDEGTKEFTDPRPKGETIDVVRYTLKDKKWILLGAPVEKAPIEIPMTGFQGFRYSKLLW